MVKKTITITEDIPGTDDLKPPKLEATYEFESGSDEAHERVKFDYIAKNFEAEMRKKFKKQIEGFALPLSSMQKEIDAMKKAYNDMTTETDPLKLVEQIKAASGSKKSLDTKIKEYNDYLKDAVKNTIEQQILVWAEKIEKDAEVEAKKKIKSDIRWKKFRHVAGAVIKGVLILGAAAAAIALTIVTFGAAAPAIAALGVAFASLGGLTALVKVGRDIKGKYDLEKRALANLEADLKVIQTHLGSIANKTAGLPKHLDDASRMCTERRGMIQATRAVLDKLAVKAREAQDKMDLVKAAGDFKGIAKQAAVLKKLHDEQTKALTAIEQAQQRDKEFEAFIDKARGVVGDLEKIPVLAPRTLLETVKQYANMDTLINGADLISSVGGSAAGLKGAVK
ncbi:hypothetical protein ASC95_28410 [Pelomonas sp. Root1217]|uniref:hypothetical protein n=1 Tax=Pelomonas sp. Root1217 TaxID=1736430 RepID=UPI00070E735C|nr:hypothetical protein [Pelomonas sp. Root1217]KQV59235.1 hypothetical protein ASC95_28410 [Pelomonas sp. Root1217]